ncbi:hypothetical protein MYX07_01940 [Patescibacteria group bacterium AH-259-L07]|nr:hypothetical protein [Patescibacteria group bacterium AH-259-L07]
MPDNFEKNLKKLRSTKDLDFFWRVCGKILKGTVVWDNILILQKKRTGLDLLVGVFTDFRNTRKKDSRVKDPSEAASLKWLGSEFLKARKIKNYQKIVELISTLTLRHIIESTKLNNRDIEKWHVFKKFHSSIGHELILPFYIFETLAFGPIFEKINSLKSKQVNKYFALLMGLWDEIYAGLRVEEGLSITNPEREKQIKEFISRKPEAMLKYYDLLERELPSDKLKKEMQKLIEQDSLYFDPYLTLADILEEEENYVEAKDILEKAYFKAMNLIVDKKGRWPKHISWGILDNRHVIRAIYSWAYGLWWDGRRTSALKIFRKLLKSNPNDNIGARYDILAIKMGYETDYAEKMFPAAGDPGYIDAIKIEQWFRKNSKKFLEEFDWQFRKNGTRPLKREI